MGDKNQSMDQPFLVSCDIVRNIHKNSKRRMLRMRQEVPLWEKANLTLEEAALYSGIGQGKLRELTNDESCPFVLWNGSKSAEETETG